ncbi:hypothetical protein P692DRAFT_20876871 [Suillus brevipes Sb2]|nr:hypothetical protein P692DRAFT_20876871 [Suillus brevipes Sb2]
MLPRLLHHADNPSTDDDTVVEQDGQDERDEQADGQGVEDAEQSDIKNLRAIINFFQNMAPIFPTIRTCLVSACMEHHWCTPAVLGDLALPAPTAILRLLPVYHSELALWLKITPILLVFFGIVQH